MQTGSAVFLGRLLEPWAGHRVQEGTLGAVAQELGQLGWHCPSRDMWGLSPAPGQPGDTGTAAGSVVGLAQPGQALQPARPGASGLAGDHRKH